jgi:hypothetical protein
MSILMVVIIIISIIAHRRAKFESQLNAMNWLIKWEDVSTSMLLSEKKNSVNNSTNNGNKSEIKKHRKSYFGGDSGSGHEKNLFVDNEYDTESLLSLARGNFNTRVVVYKRNWCFIKKINKNKIEITRSLLVEIKRVIIFFRFLN